MKFYNYEYQNNSQNNYFPRVNHLFLETDSAGIIYMSRDKGVGYNNEVNKTLNKGVSWSTLQTLTYDIVAALHDRTNEKIYFAEYESASLAQIWIYELDYGNSDNWTPMSTYGGSSHRIKLFDIFKIGTDFFTLNKYFDHISFNYYIEIRKWSGSAWNIDASSLINNGYGIDLSKTVIIDGKAYFTLQDDETIRVYMYKFDPSVPTITTLTYETNQLLPDPETDDHHEQRTLTYDGIDLIGMILEDYTSKDLYFVQYSISGDDFVVLDEYDVILMMDRDSVSGLYEKGFHSTAYEIFQIAPNYNNLFLISRPKINDVVVGISDTFFITADYEIWEYMEISDKIKEVVIDTKAGEISTSDVITSELITPGQTVQIYDDSNYFLFIGVAYKKNSKDGKEFTYKCVGYDKEISRKYTASFTSKTAKEIMQYLLDGDMNGNGTADVNQTSFLYYSSSIDNDGSFTATYTIAFKNKPLKIIYDTLMDLEDGAWRVSPDGKVYAFALADIPASGETITQVSNKLYGDTPDISQMMWELNKISLYGAIVSGARLQNEPGYGEDIPSQQLNGINEFLRHYPHINDQTVLNNFADAILARTGLTNNPINIIVSFKEIGFEQVITTLNFQFTPYPDLAVATDYYILGQTYYAKQNIATLVLSSGLIQEGREHEATLQQTSSADEEQIDNIAALVSGAGEANTASNQGIHGIGVFDAKLDVDLQFRHIAPASVKITVVLNGKDIDINVVTGTTIDSVCIGNDSRLSDSRTPLAHILGTSGPHTGTLPWAELNKTGSSLLHLATRIHANLSDAPADAHHAEDHDIAKHSDVVITDIANNEFLVWEGSVGGFCDPMGDILKQWECTETDHYSVLDDSVRQPTVPTDDSINAVDGSEDAVDSFNMETIADTEVVTSIIVWIYGRNTAGEIPQVDLYMGSWQGYQAVDMATGSDWFSKTFNGVWNQADLDGMQVRFKAPSVIGTLDLITIDAFYCEIVGGKWINRTPAEAGLIENIIEDTTPQLGGNLDLNDKGFTEEFVAAEALVNGNLCYLNGSGQMAKAKADAEATCDTLLAMCLDTISASASGTFLLFGKYTTSGLTAGVEYFSSPTTAGAITLTKPSTAGHIIRSIGTSLSTTILYFNPDKTYVEYV